MRKVITIIMLCALTLSGSGSITTFAETDYSHLLKPEEWDEVDPDSLSHAELSDAFNALRKKYSFLYQDHVDLLVEQIMASERESETDEQDNMVWSVQYYIDKFDRPTEDAYIYAIFDGKFSNSATTNSPLQAKILIDKKAVSIALYEYNNQLVTNGYSKKDLTYQVDVLDDQGTETLFTFYMYHGSDRMVLRNPDMVTYAPAVSKTYGDFIDLLKNSKSLSFYISNYSSPSNKYRFDVDNSTGFEGLYNELMAG